MAWSVPGLAWLAMVSSQVVITKAVRATAMTAVSIQDQAGIGRHCGGVLLGVRCLRGGSRGYHLAAPSHGPGFPGFVDAV